ncbi:PAS domain-containing protein [Quatrionicoccus australiensis]|uniref:PAS domain-containing protein n=1 Tax=Quatrionicoccus australiensis TaxID=138118 RepID=UPI001CF8CBF2|nr:PAS domain S-box protein [Quatrionicoccus australiensis]UCV15002.1 PAS domain S-box protein [Quatrionicoccus australiensis]
MTDRVPPAACVLTELEVAPGKTLPELCEIQHAILENAGRAIIATDTAGTVIYFNPAAQRMLGYAWSEVVGQQVASIFHLEAEIESRARLLSAELARDVQPDFGVFVARLADNQAANDEWTYVRKDGSQFPVELTVSALKDTGGGLIGYLGIASDISWRIRLEQDMQIAALAFKSQAAIMVTDAERRILRVNAAFTTLTGYSAEESMGQTPSMLKSGRHDAVFYRQMWDSLNANGHWQGEV